MNACGLGAMLVGFASIGLLRADTTVDVIVIGKAPSKTDGVQPVADAKVRLIPEEGTSGLLGYTDARGRTSIRFGGSRSFVLEVTTGPEDWMSTSRMYGRVDHNVSVYMGPSPAFAIEDALGDTGKAILNVAEDARKGLPEKLKQKFTDKSIDQLIGNAQERGDLSSDQAAAYRDALATIRNAPALTRTRIRQRGQP